MNSRHAAWMVSVMGGLILTALPQGAALADTRQDVMAGAQRCAAIADDRTWLDCFYGSAQPMRARLGLAPASARQQSLVPPAYGAAPVPVYAAPAPVYAAPAPVYAPPAYGAPTYGAPTYGAPARQPALQANGLPKPPPLPRRHDSGVFASVFGSSRPVISNVRLVSVTTNKAGRFIITLSDGEMWQQDDGDNNDTPHWRDIGRRTATVYEGALGTYNMSVSDDSTLYKVHRIN